MFSDKLRQLRLESNLTQKQLAANLHCGMATICSYENGYTEPGISGLLLIADYFNVSVDYLLDRPNAIRVIDMHALRREIAEDIINTLNICNIKTIPKRRLEK